MAYLKLRLLGCFEASLAASSSVEFPTRKAQALLAYLASNAGRRQSRERLASLLWEDFDDEHARANLRQTLKLLRRSIRQSESPCIVTDGRFVRVDSDRIETDIAEFERCLSQGTPGDLQRAADLYSGEFLEGLDLGVATFDDWLRAERIRYHDRAVEALRRLLKHPAGPADFDRRIGITLRLLSLDPLQEDVHRTLMKLYAERGDRHLAVKQYLAYRDVLRSDLGLEPGARTEQLHREIRTDESGDDGSEAPLVPPKLHRRLRSSAPVDTWASPRSARICRCPRSPPLRSCRSETLRATPAWPISAKASASTSRPRSSRCRGCCSSPPERPTGIVTGMSPPPRLDVIWESSLRSRAACESRGIRLSPQCG